MVAHFNPPLRIECCGKNEHFEFVEAKMSENNQVHIMA